LDGKLNINANDTTTHHTHNRNSLQLHEHINDVNVRIFLHPLRISDKTANFCQAPNHIMQTRFRNPGTYPKASEFNFKCC